MSMNRICTGGQKKGYLFFYYFANLRNIFFLQTVYVMYVVLSGFAKASVTILADFGPEFNPPFRWRSKHPDKNHCAYH